MKMRRGMVVVKHLDVDSIEPRNNGHSIPPFLPLSKLQHRKPNAIIHPDE
jgi:hypothetical protein